MHQKISMYPPNKNLLSLATLLGAACIVTPAVADETDDEHHVLDEVVVTATPLSRTVEQLAQPTSVIDGDALTRSVSASVGETIADQPGVTASYFGPVASRPVIRGQFGERVAVLSNGLDALDASALSEDHAVSLDSILAERIEVVRGPATLLYGSGAAGGLVNIVDARIHEQPLDEDLSGSVSLASDSALGKEAGAFKLDAGNESLAIHFDYFTRSTDDIEIPLPEDVVENTNSETDGGAAAVTVHGERGFIGVSVAAYNTNYGVPGHAHDDSGAGEEELVRIDLEQTRIDVKGELRLDGVIEDVRFRIADNDYQHVELEGAEIGTMFDTQGTDVRIAARHNGLPGLEGVIGVQYKDVDFVAVGDEAFVPGSETRQLSLFAFEEYAINDRWTLQGSARIENQDLTTTTLPDYNDDAYGASLGTVFAATGEISLALNLGLTERHPTSTELYANGPHVAVQRYERGAFATGGSAFEKESSTNLDLTLRAQFERIELNITGFVNQVDDYVLLRPTTLVIDDLQVFDYVQEDVEMYGFEAEALLDIFSTLR